MTPFLKLPGNGYLSIPQFYAGKSVFITGGSGFLGKVIIEKLLYSCSLLDKIYVLMRDKKSVEAEQRLKSMIELPVFSRLKAEKPEFLNKIVLVKGDITAPNLKMSSENLHTIKEKVSVVIHSAATVRVDEPLKVAMAVNVDGTRNVVNLSRTLKNIQSFVYVSTAFSNCYSHQRVIEERVYPPPAAIEQVYNFMEHGEDKDPTKILNGLPNTYTFSKALAENLVLDMHGDMPTVIVRPSIVTPSINEPVEGWLDNWIGATGLLTTVGKGVSRVLYAADDNIVDLIPLDYVCNLMVISAARVTRQTEVPVYNSCSGSTNPIKIKELLTLYSKACMKNGLNDLPRPDLMLCTTRYWLVKAITAWMFLVANVADFFMRYTTNRHRFTNAVRRAVEVRNVLGYFTINSWIMKTDKSQELYESLSPEDARLFPCMARDINWDDYASTYVQGVKRYLIEKKVF